MSKLLVVDINYLPKEYKELESIEIIKEKLEKEYDTKVFLIDSIKQNIQGCSLQSKPVYFADIADKEESLENLRELARKVGLIPIY